MKNKKSKAIFEEYRTLLETEVSAYNNLKTRCPDAPLPTIAARIWRLGTLAEFWASFATVMSGGQPDYLANWRAGE